MLYDQPLEAKQDPYSMLSVPLQMRLASTSKGVKQKPRAFHRHDTNRNIVVRTRLAEDDLSLATLHMTGVSSETAAAAPLLSVPNATL
jgi:hypothetical protein